MQFAIPTATFLSAKVNLGTAEVKPHSSGRSQKTRGTVGINELLRGI